MGDDSHGQQPESPGSLAGELADELDDPAAAAVRAASLLRDRVRRSREELVALAEGTYAGDELAALLRAQDDALRRTARAPRLLSAEAAGRRDSLVSWFEAYELHDGQDLARSFVRADIDVEFFDALLQKVGARHLEDAVRWLSYAVEIELAMRDIEQSTRRISALVTGARHSGRQGAGS